MRTTDEETIPNNNGKVNEEPKVNAEAWEEKKDEALAQEPKAVKKSAWADAAIGAGTGMAVGIIGTLFTSGTIPEAAAEEAAEEQQGKAVVDDGLTTPVVTDGHLSIAHSVNDSMSFDKAFRTAHDEVGPGGVFEWHGQLYGTYTAEEWHNLTAEERLAYNNHLRVVGKPDYESNVSSHKGQQQEGQSEEVVVDNTIQGKTDEQEEEETSVEVIREPEHVPEHVPEVEVLGMTHIQSEDGQDITMGGMLVDGQDFYVLDIDNDNFGDVAFSDFNHDGELDDNEIRDLSEHPLDMSIFDISDPGMSTGE